MKTKESLFEGMTVEELEVIKAGKAETLSEEVVVSPCGDGALFRCCINNGSNTK